MRRAKPRRCKAEAAGEPGPSRYACRRPNDPRSSACLAVEVAARLDEAPVLLGRAYGDSQRARHLTARVLDEDPVAEQRIDQGPRMRRLDQQEVRGGAMDEADERQARELALHK